MVGKGIGIVPALREVAKRFAQRAIIDLLDGHRREFVIDAGSAVEFLAKAVVADDDPAKLFEIRKGEPPLNAQELAVLDARLQDDQPRRLQADEVEDVRLALSNRRTITAKQAVERASVLAHIEDGWFPAASARIRRSRDACLHLGDEPVAELDDVADDFVRVADRLWAELQRSRTELWGWAAQVSHVSLLGRRSTPELDAQMQFARAGFRLGALGPIGAARRDALLGRPPNAVCPSCQRRAYIHHQPPGSRPGHLSRDGEAHLQVVVFDCLICGLTLWEEQIAAHQVKTGAGNDATRVPSKTDL